MTTNIGRTDDEQLRENVEALRQKIDAGYLNLDKVLQSRFREIDRLEVMRMGTLANRQRRIDYINREIDRLLDIYGLRREIDA